MEAVIKRILNRVATVAEIVMRITRGIDYKTLNRYIVDINKKREIHDILLEISLSLKDLLNYRLFAFAVWEKDDFNVWIDPSMYKATIRKIVEKDFQRSDDFEIKYLHNEFSSDSKPLTFESNELLSYVIIDKHYTARLYVLPNRKVFGYHKDIMQIIIKTFSTALSNYVNMKHLKNAAAIDPLTNCYNRREFFRHAESQISNSHRYGNDLSVIMFDLDNFKKVNDTYGHPVGDIVLKSVAEAVATTIRKGDCIARYGGEEFILLLPFTKKIRAMELSERLRKIVADLKVPISETRDISVTASFGVAALEKGHTKDDLIKDADDMLYKAKQNGRNMTMPQLKLYKSEKG